ncbi:VOC family protein [Aquimarina brevivitae]|uniref:Catechol 2,3-dioxygenase-like lactoylglutathione lyase family enzyme n=1 Tax=Aquimarina brevivitae TaxID=323412 RepID=A0A4Q7P101_9FLAO|nr:VOC family protein [Aquimarina brevivitae]RZS93364.1 catechol 2,3-dioxygenase-like lactoylglutathione lyase family enzyme [Aquimarina brevivitae]
MDTNFKIEFLDHVAIRVKDIKVSVEWYERVLGLKKYQLPAWGEVPIFMMSHKTGVALFPAQLQDEPLNSLSKNVKIDHFAFQVTSKNFEKAKRKFEALDIAFELQDHHYFDSLYIKDPDGHTVELTTLKVSENEFYL